MSRYITNKGDVLISIVGTIGLIGIVGESLDNANLTENCVKLIDLKNIDSNYLYYFLSSEIGQNEIKKGTVGAVQPKLPIKNIQDIDIPIPPLPTQQKIAANLSSLDDKIELNNKINNNLEQQAQALFKNWFVDFSNHSAAKCTKGGKLENCRRLQKSQWDNLQMGKAITKME
ncbi:MAG: restriction endonuclease subunit S [Treponema sp.]|nr:restriction endonuclease subunit S [Treponema sp.]